MAVDLLLHQFRKRWWSQCSPQVDMFNLISNCCTWVSKIQEPIRKLTVLVVGLDKAGKTSSVKGMLREAHGGEAGPTHGCVRHELRVENYLVTLLDLGGSADSRSRWKDFYGEAHGVIFVVDSSDRQRMKEVKEVLEELLKHPRVAGKPLLVLANKQDKMNALLGSELIEIFSLEKLVNQSRSLCHIEPCSALMDLRRWSDRKTLKGLRWLLRAVCLDYPDLCARVIHDSRMPLTSQEKEKSGKTEKVHKKSKSDKLESSKSSLRQVHRPKERVKKNKSEGKLQPIREMLQKESSLKKKLTKKKRKKTAKSPECVKDEEAMNEEEAEEETAENREQANSVLIPSKKSKQRGRTKSKEDPLAEPERPIHEDNKTHKVKGENKKKKKVVKVKKKNKINTEDLAQAYSQPVDLSSTFDLYRKAILALKERQELGQG
ncbi:hypothetical protein WMY93_009405 [Mugilogobius chulae]|uniref:ADP-ribosylation factor-like 13A n=1 Tax=Mugilogobius chulae TaxID=88201 RepID=A0AAW0PBF2_9GOBI